ncbi:MAG: DNA primase [Anaerolineae bacterium]
MSVVDDVKQRVDIVDVIGSYVHLQKAGQNYKALCPFHSEKTPSFVVFPETQTWHCFGACGTGGDVFTFIMKQEGLEFGDALRLLADRVGISLEPLDEEAKARREQAEQLREANLAAARFFQRVLLITERGAPAREYLKERGLTKETVQRFQIGYAPDAWHDCEQALQEAGYSQELLIEAGLLARNQRGNVYDRFRNRIMFPIRDPRGHVVGFAGRVLGDDVPKYLNTPQTPLFDKGRLLYGLDLAREAIRETGTAIVVEGYMDVVVPYQEGVRNLVAVMGTALTEDHVALLRPIADRVVFALDPDAAGLQATERGAEVAQQAMAHETVPVPTASGLVRYETHLKGEIRVLTLPDGMDPDELVLRDRALWDQLVRDAKPVVEHLIEVTVGDADLGTARGKREAADKVLPLIEGLSSPVERHHYRQMLARAVRVDERTLVEEARRLRGATRWREGPGPVGQPSAKGVSQEPAIDLESRAVALLVRYPSLAMDALDQTGITAEALTESLRDSRHRLICQAVWEVLPELADDTEGLERTRERLDRQVGAHVQSLHARLQGGPPLSPDMVREDLTKSTIRLRQNYLAQRMHDLEFLLSDATASGERERVAEISAWIDQGRTELRLLHQRAHALSLTGSSRR